MKKHLDLRKLLKNSHITGWHIVGSLKANAKAKPRQTASLFSTLYCRHLKNKSLKIEQKVMT
jgi:hypothetical protein